MVMPPMKANPVFEFDVTVSPLGLGSEPEVLLVPQTLLYLSA